MTTANNKQWTALLCTLSAGLFVATTIANVAPKAALHQEREIR